VSIGAYYTSTLQTGMKIVADGVAGYPKIYTGNNTDYLQSNSGGVLGWYTPYGGQVNFQQGQSGQQIAFNLVTAEGKGAGLVHYDVAHANGRLFVLTSQPGVVMSIRPQESEMIRMTGSTIGFYGVTPVARASVAADATDLATAITLVNDLKAKLVALGLVS
jgi:hypothetical protein